jgi:hypothetical protein
MILNGLALGILSTFGLVSLYFKLPEKLKELICRYRLATDAISTVATYWMFGGTATALFAAAWVGIFIEALMYINRHPEDFAFLEGAKVAIKSSLMTLRDYLKTLNSEYLRRKRSTESSPA